MALSATIAAQAGDRNQCPLQPGGRKIVRDHVGDGLEQLELVPLLVCPEHDHGLHWRTTGQPAGHLRNQDGGVIAEFEARPRPLAHPVQGRNMSGAVREGTKHAGSLTAISSERDMH